MYSSNIFRSILLSESGVLASARMLIFSSPPMRMSITHTSRRSRRFNLQSQLQCTGFCLKFVRTQCMSLLCMCYSGVDVALANLPSCLRVGLVNLHLLSWISPGWMKTNLRALNLKISCSPCFFFAFFTLIHLV